MLWKGFQRPKRIEVDGETLSPTYGKFIAQPITLCSQRQGLLLIVGDLLAILFQCGGGGVQFSVQFCHARLQGLLLAGDDRNIFVERLLCFKTVLKFTL